MSLNDFWYLYTSGQNHALGDLYKSTHQKLFFIAFKYTKNEAVAFDLLHDTFDYLLHVPIKQREEHWSDIQSIEGFLVTLIKCKALDYGKIQQNRIRIQQEIIYPQTKHVENSDFEEELQQLENLIQTLSEKEQQLLRLHLAGYKNEEIATLQNQSEKSIRNRLSESRTKLRLLWKKNYLLLILLPWIH
jgi:RNA polymerase sigma-70 factor (ECF subfamily)